jgi:2-polyprenyl-6-methoxyphenol hydroxylase-like FAD-dependent oxidoreductase
MAQACGSEAVVIGAGMGGLAAAMALSRHFEHVTVLDRDRLPSGPEPRIGTPQAWHGHALLLSGQRAWEQLYPGFEHALANADAVKMRAGLDIIWERPGYDPFPIRDLGFDDFFMSRALLEHVCRLGVTAVDNVSLRANSRVTEIVASDRHVVTAVRYENAGGEISTLSADFVVDASGRGGPTLALLETLGLPKPEVTEIGIDVGYSSTIFEVPEPEPGRWRGVVHFPRAPDSSRGAGLLPLEGNRWLLGLGGRHDQVPPGDIDGVMAFIKGLRTATIYDAVSEARQVSEVFRFNFPSSVRRHFERLPQFPRGLIPIADAVCRFNPLYGQGMSVAALEACALGQMLERREGTPDPIDGLAPDFFNEIQPLLATPWRVAEGDFVFPQTRGVRPADLDRRFRYGAGLIQLAAQDPSVHKTMAEVTALLKPGTALGEPHIKSRVMEIIQAGI